MANMSYCRFQNTLHDLRDCQNALDDGVLEEGSLDEEEASAARRLINVCQEITEEYIDEDGEVRGDA